MSSHYVKIKGIKPGKATVSIKGPNGSVCLLKITVKKPPFKLSASKLTISSAKTYTVTATGSNISKVVSSNKKILTAKKVSSKKIKLTPVKAGKVTITLTNKYGTSRKVSVTVNKKYFLSLLKSKTKPGSVIYGATKLSGKSAPGSSVSVTIDNKKYTAKTDSKGNYTIKSIPLVKVGSKLKLIFKLKGQSLTKTVTVGKGDSSVYTPNYTYKDTKKVKVEVKNAHAGDKIKITFNGKNYYYL